MLACLAFDHITDDPEMLTGTARNAEVAAGRGRLLRRLPDPAPSPGVVSVRDDVESFLRAE
ncbi:hypothetical protein Srufu_002810 [Streptomyces libani subsp. rufus]|nr:hypothetical protein Srufu_002810 [Streptomyces libani subsp. rufus]